MTYPNIPIKKYININITKLASAFSQINFSLLCLMTSNTTLIPITTRYRIFNSPDGLLEAGFLASDPEYKFAETYFSQNALSASPAQLMVASVDLEDETYAQGVAAAYAKNTFYGLAVAALAIGDATVQEISAYVQTKTMLFFYQSSDSSILDSASTNDLAYVLQIANYTRTSLWFCEASNSSRIDAAVAGMGLPGIVGSFNWAWKSLIGVTPTTATSEQQDIGTGKSCNFYTQVGGSNVTINGFTSGKAGGSPAKSSSYLDEMTGIDWLTITMEEDVFTVYLSTKKVSYTDVGVAALRGAVEKRLNIAITQDIISEVPPYVVSVIPVSQVPQVERAARTYKYITFTAKGSGAINNVEIIGSLSV